MATLAELVDGVPTATSPIEAEEVFSTLQVEDFIRGGIADLNRVSADRHVVRTGTDHRRSTAPASSTQFAYDIPIELPYRVEVLRRRTAGPTSISRAGRRLGAATGGYDFRRTPTGGADHLPDVVAGPSSRHRLHGIRVHGYAARPLPYTVEGAATSPETGLSAEEEYSVRALRPVGRVRPARPRPLAVRPVAGPDQQHRREPDPDDADGGERQAGVGPPPWPDPHRPQVLVT